MKKLIEVVSDAAAEKRAIGHFNVSDLVALRAIVEAAREVGAPVIIGTSEGERAFLGVRQAVALVRSFREEYGLPIFLNADHTHSLEKAEEAVAAGYDAVLFDGSRLPLEENIKATKEIVEYVKSVNSDVLVEGELGYIGTSSEVFEKLPEGISLKPEDLTKPEEAARFVRETGVDLFAPAVGNIHGMFAGARNPALDIVRIKAIKESVSIPLVLHGGSGTSDEDFRAAIAAGINVIHINTELRVAWRKGIEEGLRANLKEVAPYKICSPAFEAVKEVVAARLRLFNGLL